MAPNVGYIFCVNLFICSKAIVFVVNILIIREVSVYIQWYEKY